MPIRKSSVSGSSTPSGTTDERPIDPAIGDTFYNGTLGILEIYTVSGWIPATGANEFNITVAGKTTLVDLGKNYFSGSYTISSARSDSSLEIYLLDSAGQLIAYTSSNAVTADSDFSQVLLVGGEVGDVLSFSYKTTFLSSDINNQIFSFAGPTAISADPTSMPAIDDFTTITGRNFATDIQAYVVGQDGTEIAVKSLSYLSETQIIITRPDSMSSSNGPYSVKLINPTSGALNQSGSNVLTNAISAGTTPSWQTPAIILEPYSLNVPYSYTVSASDQENSAISYSLVSGQLPAGLSLNSATGEIGGTVSSSSGQEAFATQFTIRATDDGGNFLDRTFTIYENIAPVWVTPESIRIDVGRDFNLNASGQIYETSVLYSLEAGSLDGMSLSSNGVISGQPLTATDGQQLTFSVRATDSAGLYSIRSFTATINFAPTWVTSDANAITVFSDSNSFQFTAISDTTGGNITYEVQSGTLFDGLSLSSLGVLSGGSLAADGATTTITVRATDSTGLYTDRDFTLASKNRLFEFTSHTFTHGGSVLRTGPLLSQLVAEYSTPWASNTSYFNMTTAGKQRFTVPISGTYQITISGASGGNSDTNNGGNGYRFTSNLNLASSNILEIVVGQKGLPTADGDGAAGGGASYVYNASTSTLLLVAGGGGGAGVTTAGKNGNSGTDGTAGDFGGGGGQNGQGGSQGTYSSGGGGWLSAGENSTSRSGSFGGAALSGTAIGGTNEGQVESGNFGSGGGGGNNNGYGGGGGGYSGGGGGGCCSGGGGGGGGSYSVASKTNGGFTNGNGYVTIEFVG